MTSFSGIIGASSCISFEYDDWTSPGTDVWSCSSSSYNWHHQQRPEQLWLTSAQVNKFTWSIFIGLLLSLKKNPHNIWGCLYEHVCYLLDFACVLFFKNMLESLEIFKDAESHFEQDSLILGSKSGSPDLYSFSKVTCVSSLLIPSHPSVSSDWMLGAVPQAWAWCCLSVTSTSLSLERQTLLEAEGKECPNLFFRCVWLMTQSRCIAR